jgi:hypothetical protein
MQTELSLSPGNSFGHFSPARPRVPGVVAEIAYLSPETERPYTFMYTPPDGTAWDNCKYQVMPVQIADARAMASPPSIDVEGFELWDAPTSVTDFSDKATIERRYYPESVELAKQVTGADHAMIFDHAVRRREAGRPPLNFGRNGNALGAVGRVHVDYSETSGQRRLELTTADSKTSRHPRRFAIVNIWRSIAGKIVDTPLALCDARSVSVQDLVTAELRYPSRNGELCLVRESLRHRWAYFSQMDKDEALIFKQYDSQVNSVARFIPHSAFDLPEIPSDAPLRESIEVRCLVLYY